MINSLYIHIPFCIKKCIYCDFCSIPYDESLALNYTDAVIGEIELVRELAGELETVYIGGGTPTVLPTMSLIRLSNKIKDSFMLSSDVEITVEVNPGTVDMEKARVLSGAGVNRFSIGVQSFDDNELKFLGRVHGSGDAIKAIAAIRYAGIRNLSIDLIYGLPGQALNNWYSTIRQAIEIMPEHISTYELTPEKGTPLYEAISRGELEKPNEETIIEMYYHAIGSFADAGYRHYEISNFARPGFECRHNLNYWNRGQYIGVGAGAHSFIEGRRIRNTGNVEKYIEALSEGDSSVVESSELSREDAVKESIFLGLRKREGLDIRKVREYLGIDVSGYSHELMDRGLLMVEGDHLKLTNEGIMVSNSVIAELFDLLDSPEKTSK